MAKHTKKEMDKMGLAQEDEEEYEEASDDEEQSPEMIDVDDAIQ